LRTNPFFSHPGDTLLYARMFGLGAPQFGDTLNMQGPLSTSDYVKGRIVLRKYSNNALLAVLDTCLLNHSGYVSSTDLTDGGYRMSAMISPDSVYLSMDIARGDTTDSYILSYLEAYGDPVIINDTTETAYKRSQPKEQPTQAGPASESFNVRVHPNPASDHVLICVDEIPADQPFFADVVSATGAPIAKIYDATPEGELGLCYVLDCKSLAPGNYFVRVSNGSKGRVIKFTVAK
jgi:hypothetical protein